MVNLFFSSILVVLICTPFGLIIGGKKYNYGSDFEQLSCYLIYSTILISFLALLLNFFTSLNFYINSSLAFFSLIIILMSKRNFISVNFLLFSIIAAIIIFFLLCESHTYRPDSGIYHFPFINILNNEKIIFGLSNFQFRFGHISIIQYFSAILNNFIFSTNGMVFASAIFYAGVAINFFSKIIRYLNEKKYDYHFFYLIGVSVYIFGKMNRYGEFGNDTPSHLIFFFLISEVLKKIDNYSIQDIKNYFLISIFIILNKITLSFAIIIPLILLKKKYVKKIFLSNKILFSLAFLCLWLLKNVIISGCIVYPVESTCFKNFKWTNIEEVKLVSNENEAWSKNWPGYNKVKKISHADYIKNFDWISTWIKFTGLKTFKIIIVYNLFLLIIFLLFFFPKIKLKKSLDLNKKPFIKYISLILLVATFVWFVKLPDFRYGTSYIVSLLSIIFAIICNKFILKENFQKNIMVVLIMLILVFAGKNSIRIVKEKEKYYNYPWPKYFSHNDDNIYISPKKITLNGKNLYVPINGYCMYGLSPCSNKKTDLVINTKFNYFFFLKENKVKK